MKYGVGTFFAKPQGEQTEKIKPGTECMAMYNTHKVKPAPVEIIILGLLLVLVALNQYGKWPAKDDGGQGLFLFHIMRGSAPPENMAVCAPLLIKKCSLDANVTQPQSAGARKMQPAFALSQANLMGKLCQQSAPADIGNAEIRSYVCRLSPGLSF